MARASKVPQNIDVNHNDIFGNKIEIGMHVIGAISNYRNIDVCAVTNLTNLMVRVMSVTNKNSWLAYSKQLVIIDSEDVTAYVLRNDR
jgi:hypothetical protein